LKLVCEPSRRLVSEIKDGSVDVALVTEGEAAVTGMVVHRERLIWAASARHDIHDQDPVPLAIFHTGDIFRRYAIEQLQALGRRARIRVISPSYAGISASVDAGIAVAVLFKSNLRPQWRMLGVQEGYPELPELGIVLERGREKSEIVDRFVEHIVASFRST
jgi:DNA-binding transcriptional LysR family regulator